MTRNQTNRDEPYGLQPLAQANRAIVQSGGETWAEAIHAQLGGGHLAPNGKGHARKLRAMFKAIRTLEVGDDRQKKKARELARFLELTWGLQKAYVTVAEGDIDAMRELRERWGDVQLPPVDGGFVNGVAADEAIIDAIVRRLG
jgi:hypothetical protein